MQRFLKSIGIDDIDRFDLDFDLVSRNSLDKNQVDMLIAKNTPWDFSLLEEFMHGLESIKYPYRITFSYVQKPTVYETIQMFNDWHRSHNRFPSEITLEGNGNIVRFIFNSEKQKED